MTSVVSDKKGQGRFVREPMLIHIGEFHREQETRLEVIVPIHVQEAVIDALKRSHPYEEPAFDLIPLSNRWEQVGSGVVGALPEPVDEVLVLEKLKEIFKTGCVKHSPLHNRKISRIALCGGAGASLITKAVIAGADMFVTGEIRYHDYFEFESHILLAEIGHYESEQYTNSYLCNPFYTGRYKSDKLFVKYGY